MMAKDTKSAIREMN